MSTLESLGLKANQWQFLRDWKRYVEASKRSGRELVPASTERQFSDGARHPCAPQRQPRRRETARNPARGRCGARQDNSRRTGAWVVASADPRRKVRILAPKRRDEEELGERAGGCMWGLSRNARSISAFFQSK